MKIKLASRWGGKRGDSGGGEVRYSVGGPYPPNGVTPGPRQRKLFLLDYVRVTELLTDFEIFQNIKNRFFSLPRGGHMDVTWISKTIHYPILENPGEIPVRSQGGGPILSVKGQACYAVDGV